MFPGFVGAARPQGDGETHVLRGTAVVTAGYLPRAQEALVDLVGPAAALSPLGATHNLVLEFVPAPDVGWIRSTSPSAGASLSLAAWLVESALESGPDAVEELPSPRPARGDLPRIGAITNLQTQGLFKDVFVYGHSFGPPCRPCSTRASWMTAPWSAANTAIRRSRTRPTCTKTTRWSTNCAAATAMISTSPA